MKKASQIIKLCGLKSTKQVAEANGITTRTVQLAFKNDKKKFNVYVLRAVDSLYEDARDDASEVLTTLTNNR